MNGPNPPHTVQYYTHETLLSRPPVQMRPTIVIDAPTDSTGPSILFVCTVASTLEAFLLPFADRLHGRGWQVDALARGAGSNSRIAGSFDHLFDIDWSRNALAPGNLFGSIKRVRQVVRAGNYELVHVHTPVAAFVTRLALRSMGDARPIVIYTAHGFHYYKGGGRLRNLIFRWLEKTASKWTDFIVTMNQEDFDAARAFDGIMADRVRFIPGVGVDTAHYSPSGAAPEGPDELRASLFIPQDAFVLTIVAELGAVKRHAHLLSAIALVKDPRVVLLIVGEGSLEPELRNQAQRLNIAERIRWAGYRSDIASVLGASDALALVSEREGLNRSVLEAMSAGIPVIGTATRGIADAVAPDAGWIVDKRDVPALAAAIDEAAAAPDEASRRGAIGRLRVKERYALPLIIAAYEELYREALALRV